MAAHHRLDGAGTAVKGRGGIPVSTVGDVTLGNAGCRSSLGDGTNGSTLNPEFRSLGGSGGIGGNWIIGSFGGGGGPGDTLN